MQSSGVSLSLLSFGCSSTIASAFQDRAWFERVIQIVKNANPYVPRLDIRGPDDAENAIFRQFGVKLPLATV
jgi:hypothetical protein